MLFFQVSHLLGTPQLQMEHTVALNKTLLHNFVPESYSKQLIALQTLLHLHRVIGVNVSSSSAILLSVHKL